MATGRPTSLARVVLGKSELKQIFDFIKGVKNLDHKPNPAAMNSCLTEFTGYFPAESGNR